MQIKTRVPIVIILIALIFAGLSFYYPWWSIRTAKEAEITLNITARADYGISQLVSASVTTGNETQSALEPIANLTTSETNKSALSSMFDMTIILSGAGMALIILSLAFIIISISKKPLYNFTTISMIIAAIFLIAAPFYVAATLPPLFINLDSVMPVNKSNLPSAWVPISPKDIENFWGSKPIPKSNQFPAWIQGQNFWIWGAALGWYLAFTAGLLLFASAFLIRYYS
jgi:glucan phosphoethanolaminetransferase (alkaline phosphatase superfamily)